MSSKILFLYLIFLLIYRNSSALSDKFWKIINGYPIPIENVNYQVSIRLVMYDTNFGHGHNCGGSLISRTSVVTAAHCFFNQNKLRSAKDFRIVAGNENLTQLDGYTFISGASKVIPHPDYRNEYYEHDVGIIKLKTAVPSHLFKTAGSIQLPNSTYNVGANCTITGWGTTRLNGKISDVLMAANVEINNLTICNGVFGYNGLLSEGMICAGPMAGGVDACQGDSGGPLQCNGELVGIVSFGDGCGFPYKPGIYTDVFHYVDWIIANSGMKFSSNFLIKYIFFIIFILHFY